MKIAKKIKDIKFDMVNVYGEMMEVSEPIVMASAGGWYVGKVCREDGFVQPYDRYTEYMTQESAQKCLESFNCFKEDYGVVQREFGGI